MRPAYILFGDRDNQTEVGFGEALLGIEIPLFDGLGELYLIITGKERYPTDFLQIHLHEIGSIISFGNFHCSFFFLLAFFLIYFTFSGINFEHFLRTHYPYSRSLQMFIEIFEVFEILFNIGQDMNNFIFSHETALLATSQQFIKSTFLHLLARSLLLRKFFCCTFLFGRSRFGFCFHHFLHRLFYTLFLECFFSRARRLLRLFCCWLFLAKILLFERFFRHSKKS